MDKMADKTAKKLETIFFEYAKVPKTSSLYLQLDFSAILYDTSD